MLRGINKEQYESIAEHGLSYSSDTLNKEFNSLPPALTYEDIKLVLKLAKVSEIGCNVIHENRYYNQAIEDIRKALRKMMDGK